MEMVYKVNDRPPLGKAFVYALQQMLAILAATIAVPAIINTSELLVELKIDPQMSQAAALFGAGVGTLVYQLFTKFKSPVFLGSSFAFIGSMLAAFAGATTVALGYLGLLFGAIFAGLIYVVLALVVKFCGTNWIKKLMPPVVIGPTVAIIGLSLAGNAIDSVMNGAGSNGSAYFLNTYSFVGIICGMVALFATILTSVYGGKNLKLIPFIIGIGAGYLVATLFTVFGYHIGGNVYMKVIDFEAFTRMQWLPDFSFIKAFGGFKDLSGAYIGTIAVAYIPVAFVVFAEHLADHKNISSIIGSDLLEDPGLDRTLLGDGIGSMAGALFGGCPNTTYGESVGCVAITKNASVFTITLTAIMCIVAAFIAPFVTLLGSIPSCVINGVCIALYGFIAVSGLKMVQKVDLEDSANLFTVSTILITGIGGFALTRAGITLTEVACALILGIIVNYVCHLGKNKKEVSVVSETAEETETVEKTETTEEENK